MSQRVLITSNTFKVSAPGYDASTAGVRDLVFDSSAGQAMSVYQTGTFTAPVTSYVTPPGGGPAQPQFTRITFPSLGYVPMVLVQMIQSGSSAIAGGMWMEMETYDGFGNPITPTPTAEQQTPYGGRVLSADGYIEFQNYAEVAQTVRYVIFYLPT